ncbi:MAG: hypothetical protein SFU85_11405 [Candidatus Methylacidiphilales bacterium]|nr:hypothetical protein [Candidatus Methylacidiphilales bacterium]
MQPSFFDPAGAGEGAARILAALDPGWPGDGFDDLALALLRQQAEMNPAYRRLLDAICLDPARAGSWSAFPAMPAASFKDVAVCAFPEPEAVACFETSGTTTGRPGRHFFRSLVYYEKALESAWRLFLPDLSGHLWVSLIPPASARPSSSLSHMVSHLSRQVAGGRVEWCCGADYQIDHDKFKRTLAAADRPVLLLGTSFALAGVAERVGLPALPGGSVVFDTGGFKGRHREIPREEFYRLLSESFGLPLSSIWNEYGMTEWSSQGYARADTGLHRFPPWMRIVLRDPVTGDPVARGETGVVEAYDLANIGSVVAVGTRDLARWEEGGLRLLGRVADADARGCSLSYE